MALEFSITQTPNPNALKFTANQSFIEGRLSASKGGTPTNKLADALLAINGVDSIFGFDDFITVNKTADAEWNDLLPSIESVLNQFAE